VACGHVWRRGLVAQFPNSYADDPEKAKPAPGVIAHQYATMLKWLLSFVGVKMYPHEIDALATFLGAVIRAYPQLKDKFTPQDDGDAHKG
jgi:hypothetical protein